MAAPALQHQLFSPQLHFLEPRKRASTKTHQKSGLISGKIHNKSQTFHHLLPVFASSSETTNTETAESCVNSGLSLFSKGRAILGGEDIGYGFRKDLKLISEVQAPFRGVRRFFYVALAAAAGISTFFIVPRLIRALQGGDSAPDIWETAGNAAINIGGIIVLVALFIWDNKKEEEQLAQISRDETLSRLPLRLSTNRIVELVQLRDTSRPVILAGNKDTVSRAIEKAERFRTDLVRRGVLLIPVIWGEDRRQPIERKGFGNQSNMAASLPSIGEDFEKRTQSITAKSRVKAETRFKAEIVSPDEWERWIRDQQKFEGVTPGEDVYIILRLDGRVRRSGRGMPDWPQIIKELPQMDALLSKLER